MTDDGTNSSPGTSTPSASGGKQVSALQRLQSLPAIFSGKDLTIRFQWTSKTASQYLFLWKKRGLVEALGGHSDTFANLLVQDQPDWERALRMAMPSAVIVGVDVLRRNGWTTQIWTKPDVAVDSTMPVYSLGPSGRFTIVPRSPAWFAVTRRGINKDGLLQPAWALADLLAREGWGACGLQPDDIDWDVITERDRRQWVTACEAYGLQSGRLDRAGELQEASPERRQRNRG